MPESAMLADSRAEPGTAGEPQIFEKLRELARNGYVPVPEPGPGGGMLLRHDNAPDLLLHPDGRIDLPAGIHAGSAAAMRSAAPAPETSAGPRRMSKLRTLLMVLFAALFWIMSLALTSSILHG